MSFLRAEWQQLILANYELKPELLLPFLPAKTELDAWQGKYYVSLVGFMFMNTRLLGLKIPGHVNFPEVNLRFYVRHYDGRQWKRGVTDCPLPAYLLSYQHRLCWPKAHPLALSISADCSVSF